MLVVLWRNDYGSELAPLHTSLRFLPLIHTASLVLTWRAETGKLGSKVIGIVTPRDTQFHDNDADSVTVIMSTDLVTARSGIDLVEANTILQKSKKGKLPIVDDNDNLHLNAEPTEYAAANFSCGMFEFTKR